MAWKLEDAEAALDLLEPLVPNFSLSVLKAFVADPDFDGLRGNPRFDRMIDHAKRRLAEGSPIPAAS
jgi:hypothetical protein